MLHGIHNNVCLHDHQKGGREGGREEVQRAKGRGGESQPQEQDRELIGLVNKNSY